MQIFKELKKARKIDCFDKTDKRSFLIIESLVRQKLCDDSNRSTVWSPTSVIEYVETSKPCKTLSDELSQYRKYISSKLDLRFWGSDSQNIH